MSDFPCRLRNISNRPVELHMAGTTTVLPPKAELLVAEHDAYCAVLIRQGVLSRHDPPPPKTEKPAPKTVSRGRKATGARKASAVRKASGTRKAPAARKAAKPNDDNTGEAK